MNNSLLNVKWSDIDKFSEEEITYFLSLEGKSTEALCKIRGLTKEVVQTHLIQGKIKYRFLAKSKTVDELFSILCKLPKEEKLTLISNLEQDVRRKLVEFIKKEYISMSTSLKETAVWLLGELKAEDCLTILQKAVVHKHINIRRMAVSALGKIGDNTSENALIRALEDNNAQVVSYAIKALSKIKSQRAHDKIKNIYDNADKEYVKRAAKEYLDSI